MAHHDPMKDPNVAVKAKDLADRIAYSRTLTREALERRDAQEARTESSRRVGLAVQLEKLVGQQKAQQLIAEAADTLTARGRKRLDPENFAIPAQRKYPIHDLDHARNALARVAQVGTPEEQRLVKAAVYKRYPALAERVGADVEEGCKKRKPAKEAFCPTGPGGGQDNSCSAKGGEGGKGGEPSGNFDPAKTGGGKQYEGKGDAVLPSSVVASHVANLDDMKGIRNDWVDKASNAPNAQQKEVAEKQVKAFEQKIDDELRAVGYGRVPSKEEMSKTVVSDSNWHQFATSRAGLAEKATTGRINKVDFIAAAQQLSMDKAGKMTLSTKQASDEYDAHLRYVAGIPEPYEESARHASEAFCGTGKGGGVDNTCSSRGGGDQGAGGAVSDSGITKAEGSVKSLGHRVEKMIGKTMKYAKDGHEKRMLVTDKGLLLAELQGTRDAVKNALGKTTDSAQRTRMEALHDTLSSDIETVKGLKFYVDPTRESAAMDAQRTRLQSIESSRGRTMRESAEARLKVEPAKVLGLQEGPGAKDVATRIAGALLEAASPNADAGAAKRLAVSMRKGRQFGATSTQVVDAVLSAYSRLGGQDPAGLKTAFGAEGF